MIERLPKFAASWSSGGSQRQPDESLALPTEPASSWLVDIGLFPDAGDPRAKIIAFFGKLGRCAGATNL